MHRAASIPYLELQLWILELLLACAGVSLYPLPLAVPLLPFHVALLVGVDLLQLLLTAVVT